MKKVLIISLITILSSCSKVIFELRNKNDLLVSDINISILTFRDTYYRYPTDNNEYHNFIMRYYGTDEDQNVKKEWRHLINYVNKNKDKIYIYSNKHFMFFFGKKYEIVIEQPMGVCERFVGDNDEYYSPINKVNIFDANNNVMFNLNDEFEIGLSDICEKYKNISHKYVDSVLVVNRALLEFDPENGLNILCQTYETNETDDFIFELERYLELFIFNNPSITKILFYSKLRF